MKFLNFVSRDLLSHGLQNIKNYTLVFPMHRAGLFMKEAIRDEILRSRHAQPVLLPKMLTLDELVTDLSGMQLEDELSSVCLLYQLCRKHAADDFKMSLDVFYGWGRQLLTDFSNIEMLCLAADKSKELLCLSSEAEKLDDPAFSQEDLARFYKLLGYSDEKLENNRNIRQTYLELWGHLPEIFMDFREHQLQEKQGSRGALTSFVCEHFAETAVQHKLQGKHFVFVGFNYLLKGERLFMQLLKQSDACRTSFYWDECSDFKANGKAFYHVSENIKLFGQDLTFPSGEAAVDANVTSLSLEGGGSEGRGRSCLSSGEVARSAGEEPGFKARPVKVISSASSAAQAQYVNKWLTALYGNIAPLPELPTEDDLRIFEAAIRRVGTAAVVIADESMLEQVIYALPGHISGFVNITKGYPLRNTRVFADLLAVLNSESDKAPALVLDQIERAIARMEQEEREADDASWRHQLKQESFYQVCLVITRMRRILADPELSPLITDVKVLRCLMRRHLESVTMPFHGAPLTPIQVIGVLETRLLDFDHLLVLNCEEGTLPRVSADTSFLPFYVRKYYGMQTRTEEAEVYAYNFFRLLRHPQDVTLLFSESSGKKSMSRFLMQLLTSPREFTPTYAVLSESDSVEVPALDVTEPDAPKSYYEQYLRTEERRRNEGKAPAPFRLSPSAINAYIGCPRRFYLQYVLGVYESVEADGHLFAANELGSLVHATIQHAYLQMTGGALPADIDGKMIQAFLDTEDGLSSALDAAYQAVNDDYFLHHPDADRSNPPYQLAAHPAENIVIEKFARRVLEQDAESFPFRLIGMEIKRYCSLPVVAPDGRQIELLTGGSIDRLDMAEEEPGHKAVRIIDYKTGSFDPNKFMAASLEAVFAGEKDYLLQTLTYCLTCMPGEGRDKAGNKIGDITPDRPLMPELLYLRKREADPHLYLGVDDAKQPVTDFAQQKDEFRELLIAKAQEIAFQTTFEPCSEGKCPSYCPFFDLCGRTKPSF